MPLQIKAHQSTMTFAVELNNIGCAFLRKGSLEEAFESFKVAVELMKQTTARKENRAVRRRSVSRPLQILKAKYEEGLKEACGTENYPVVEPNGACFVSKKAIALPAGVVFDTDSWESSVLLFNLALSLHLMGLEPGMQMFLTKSLKLYRLSKKLLTQHLEESKVEHSKEVGRINIRLVMSILNNMGHVYYEIGEYVASRAYFDGLRSMVSENSRSKFEAEELEGLLLNAVVLTAPAVAAAA